MTELNKNDTFEPGEIRFVDNYVPSLTAGHYTIKVSQSLEGSGAYQAKRMFSETQSFTVSGPRFRLDPSDIYAMYPPPNSQGNFGKDLPHILLTKRALPWERSLFQDREFPWMALLLFDSSEILPPVLGTGANSKGPNPTGITTITVQELVDQKQDGPVTFRAYSKESIDDSEIDQLCQVFDITPEIFKRVMPNPEQARILAHCRQVNLAPKAVVGPTRPGAEVAPGNDTAWFSVVVGGRFPAPPASGQAGEVNVVHLVSLEGFEGYIDNQFPVDFPPEVERIRLVSLASWTFTCLPESGESFGELMLGLVAENTKEALKFKLRAQPPGPGASAEDDFAFRVLEAGYIPCRYQTRQGEQTFAWYRGPFSPQPIARFPADRAPFLTSSEVMIYDQEHGLFDLSYAVAWETGRLLALSDQRFGVTLLNWRRKTHRLIDLLRERIEHNRRHDSPFMVSKSQQLSDPLEKNLLCDTFMSQLLGHFADKIEPVIFKPLNKVPVEPASLQVKVSVPASDLADLYQDEETLQRLKQVASQELGLICEWLAHLFLLYGIPFNNLVAHEGLLPPESIRFFYLDRNWLDVMLDGALSIGIQSSRDALCQQVLYDIVREEVQKLIHAMRDRLLGGQALPPASATAPSTSGPLSGLLLRSAVVSGWPGLEIRAYRHSDGQKGSELISLLRMDHLSEDVLLCIFAQVPAWIELNEPKEGLHFGVVEGAEGQETIGLRHLSGSDVGKLIKQLEIPGCDEHRMLDIQILLDKMKENIPSSAEGELGPAAFALQMAKVPEQMIFQTSCVEELRHG